MICATVAQLGKKLGYLVLVRKKSKLSIQDRAEQRLRMC